MFRFFRIPSVVLCLLVFSSCQKEVDFNTPVVPDGSFSGSFTAKIEGVPYTAEAATGSMLRGVMTITAYSKDKKLFAIAITDTVTGTYTLNQTSHHAVGFVDSTDVNKNAFVTNQGNDTSQAGGKVTITSIDKVKKIITGTFSCKVFREMDGKRKVITEGSFTVPYTSSLPVAKTTDTFQVKIDGADWTAKSITAVVTGGLLAVNGSDLNLTKIIGFQLPRAITAGTYDFDISSDYVGIYLPDGIMPITADTGKLTVLERNTTLRRIRVSFNFKGATLLGTESHQLTNGYFSVSY